MNRRRGSQDPAYLQLMREAKELFDAEIARAAMKRKGRPPKAAAKAAVVEHDDELDHEVELAVIEVEAEEEVAPTPPPPPPPKKKAAKAAKTPTKATKAGKKK